MCSRRVAQTGFTMIEMIVTIVLFSAMAAVGSLLISKLAPSYLVGVQAEQALSPREAALWRLSEDFRRALIEGTSFDPPCTLNMVVASGVTGDNSKVVETQAAVYWWSNKQLWMSAPWTSGVSSLLLDNVAVTGGGSCPFNYMSGIGTVSRAQLNVAFLYSAGVNEPVAIPVSTTLFSYVNSPYVASISPVSGAVSSTVAVSIGGYFPGLASGIVSSVTFMSGTIPVSSVLTGGNSGLITANISSVESAGVDVRVATPEGWNILKKAFTFQ